MRRRLLIVGTLIVLLGSLSVAHAEDATVMVRGADLAEFPRVQLQLDVPALGGQPGGQPEFEVLENGRKTDILSADEQTADPVDVILVIDTSGSMKGASLAAAKSAAAAFIAELQPESRVGVIAFASKARLVSPIGLQDSGLLQSKPFPRLLRKILL